MQYAHPCFTGPQRDLASAAIPTGGVLRWPDLKDKYLVIPFQYHCNPYAAEYIVPSDGDEKSLLLSLKPGMFQPWTSLEEQSQLSSVTIALSVEATIPYSPAKS